MSLCLVVKDEAPFVADCIRSASPICDDLVVVDTGSTDGTPDVARALGARVYEQPWPGDLGAAHDLPLAHARGDECLDPAAHDVILGLCTSGSADGYEFTFRNYVNLPQPAWRSCRPDEPMARGAAGWVPSRAVRLFRNRRGYHHAGFVHQRIGPSILAAGDRVTSCCVTVHHYGPLKQDRGKSALYAALARRQVDARGNALDWHELGIALTHVGDDAGCVVAFRRARDLGLVAEASFHLGRAAASRGYARAALRHLDRALAALRTDEGLGVHRADIHEEMGRSLDVLGRRAEAKRAYRAALACRRDSPIALSELAALLLEDGRLSEAARLCARLVAGYPRLALSWTAFGNLHVRRGAVAAACAAYCVALALEEAYEPARRNLALVRSYRFGAGRQKPPAPMPRSEPEVKVTFPRNATTGAGGRVRPSQVNKEA